MHGVANPPSHPALREHVQKVEAGVRSRFADIQRADLASLPELQAYRRHYSLFGKTYHVRLQLESLLFKGKPLQSGAALVEAMFAAEMSNMLLTAGHDLDNVAGPVTVDVSRGDEMYVTMSGREQTLKEGDMMMRDESGVISSVLYGPDQRTRLTSGTRRVLFTVYAPDGIGGKAVRKHLEDIRASVALVSPEAVELSLDTYPAS